MLTGLLCALAAPPLSVSIESTGVVPDGWAVVGRSSSATPIELTFAVKQENIDRLHDELMAVSSPDSARYGQHLSNAQVHSLVAPAPRNLAAVRAFAPGAVAATPNGDLLTLKTTIGAAETLLDATYEELEHTKTGTRVHRCIRSSYRVPAAVAAAVDFIAPTVHVPGVRSISPASSIVESADDPNPSHNNVPATLRELYSVGLPRPRSARVRSARSPLAFRGRVLLSA